MAEPAGVEPASSDVTCQRLLHFGLGSTPPHLSAPPEGVRLREETMNELLHPHVFAISKYTPPLSATPSRVQLVAERTTPATRRGLRCSTNSLSALHPEVSACGHVTATACGHAALRCAWCRPPVGQRTHTLRLSTICRHEHPSHHPMVGCERPRRKSPGFLVGSRGLLLCSFELRLRPLPPRTGMSARCCHDRGSGGIITTDGVEYDGISSDNRGAGLGGSDGGQGGHDQVLPFGFAYTL